MSNRNAGWYWRIAWSHDWRSGTPWSLGGSPAPYIGTLRSANGAVVLRTLGPLALIGVKVRAVHTDAERGEGE